MMMYDIILIISAYLPALFSVIAITLSTYYNFKKIKQMVESHDEADLRKKISSLTKKVEQQNALVVELIEENRILRLENKGIKKHEEVRKN